MTFSSGQIVARIAGASLLAAGLTLPVQTTPAQTTTTQVMTVRSPATGKSTAAAPALQIAPNGTRYKKVAGQSSSAATNTQTKVIVTQAPAVPATSKNSSARPAFKPGPRPAFAPAPTVVASLSFGNATVGSTPVTMTLNYPADATSKGASSVVPAAGVAPGSSSDYIFFGNSHVEFGLGGGGQPSNLTNFTVSTLNNVEYPGNSNYTTITAPGGSSPFTTGTLTENPSNYPNTTPHTTLLATFSPLNAGSFTVYILDGNTDGVYVGNSSVGLGVNGGAAVVTTSRFLSGTNEFTRYNVANASPSDVFQVYATTSTNSYPSIGGLTFVMGTSSQGLTAATTANLDFKVSSSNCTGSTCTVQVTFTPSYPGLRYDALNLIDSNQNIVYQTYLYGVGMAPQFGYDIGTEFIYSSYLPSPLGVAIGPDEYLYYTSTGSNTIFKYSPGVNNGITITLNGLATPSGIVVDGANTLYVADQTNNIIVSYSATGVQGTVPTSPLNGPSQLAVDGTGALYIADTGNGRIVKIDNQGNETTIASGLTSPTAVAVDSAGDVYYADRGNSGEIFELVAGTTTPIPSVSGLNETPINLAIEASGELLMTTTSGLAFFYGNGQINFFYASGTDVAYGLALDRNGDVYLTLPQQNNFIIDQRSTGNFILNTPPNTTASGSLGIDNTGNLPLSLSNFTIQGSQFSIATLNQGDPCQTVGTLQPGSSCQVNVSFTPPLAQAYTGTQVTTSNNLNVAGSTDSFTIYGYGTGAPSITTVSAAPSAVENGKPDELLVTVSDSPQLFTPTGQVTFMDGSTVLGTANLTPGATPGTATATLTTSFSTNGTHTITASFPADLNVSPSTSNTLTVTVGPANYLPSGLPPTNSQGQPSVVTQNLGSIAVGSNMYVVLNTPYSGAPSVTSTSTEFTVSNTQCGSSGCSIAITFTPAFPGLRSGAVLLQDSQNNVIEKYYLTGTGTAPQFAFDPGTDSVFSGTIITPTALTYGQDGNLYVGDASTNQVYNAQNGNGGSYGPPSTPLPVVNLGVIGGIAVDASRQVFITDQTNNLIVTYDQVQQLQSSVTTDQLSRPGAIVVDGSGDLFVADIGNNRIIKVDLLGNETTIVSNIPATLGPLALDSAGNLYYAVTANPGTITEIPAAGGQPIVIANNIGAIHGLAVDAAGRVYYTNDAGLSIFPVSNCGTFCNLEGLPTAGFPAQAIIGLALDPAGDIFLTQPNSGEYVESVRSTGNGLVTGPAGSTTPGAPWLVSNTGNMPLTISAIAFTAPQFFHGDATSACANGTVLAAGQICSTIPDFTPPQPQPYLSPVIYTSNSLNANQATAAYYIYGDGTPASGGPGTTTLALSPSGSFSLGNTLTLSATVGGVTSAAPTGTVNFLNGSTVIASGTLIPNGTGSTSSVIATSSTLAIGAYTITAMYVGDSHNPSSTSASQTINVTQATPSVYVSGLSSITVGQSETLTASITGAPSFPPTGSVNFLDGDSLLGSASVSSEGTATLTVTTLSVGRHIISAQYSGDSNYNHANSYPLTVTVGPIVSSTNFGSATVGSSTPMTLTFPAARNGSFTSVNNADFALSNTSCSSTCTATVTFTPQSPGLRYGSVSLHDNLGNLVAETFVYGTGLAPQFAFDPPYNQGAVTPYTAQNPVGIAVGPDGTVYVSDSAANTVTAYPINGNSTAIPLGDIGSVGAIAVDGANTVYVVDNLDAEIVTSTSAGVVGSVNVDVGGSGSQGPGAIAVDGTGALYIDDTFNQRILKIDNQGIQTTLATTNSNSTGLAVDASGNVFYTDSIDSSGIIDELPAGGGSPITVSSGLGSNIGSLALDAAGRFYYLNNGETVTTLSGLSPGTATPGYYFTVSIPRASGVYTGGLAITPTGGILAGETLGGTGSVVLFDRKEAGGSTSAQVGATAQLVFPISNTGDSPLNISSLSINGPAFTIDSASTCVAGGTIAPDRECLVTVDFTPPAAQNYQVPLTVTTNNLGVAGIQNVFTLNGVGGDSGSIKVQESASSITLGQSVVLTATITDNVSTVTPTGTVTFQVGGPVGTVTLTAGSTPGTATASYTYTPTLAGTFAVNATYNGDSTIAPLTGTPQQLQVNQSAGSIPVNTLNFGTVPDASSASASLTVGGSGINYIPMGSNASIRLANSYEFSITSLACSTSCTLTVKFAPLYPGLRTTGISVVDQNGNVLAKTFVYGIGTGAQFAFDPGLASNPYSATNPLGLASGPDGSIYVGDAGTNKVTVNYNGGGGGSANIPLGNIGSVGAVAVDSTDTVYVVDNKNAVIVDSTAAGVIGTVATSPLGGTGSLGPAALAVDGTGALYIDDTYNHRIIKIDNQGNETRLASTNSSLGLSLDAAGDVFYTDVVNNSGVIIELPVGGGSAMTVASGLPSSISSLALDDAGRFYFLAYTSGTGSMYYLTPGGAPVQYPLTTNGTGPVSLAIDYLGDVLVGNVQAQSVQEFVRSVDNASVATPTGTTTTTVAAISNTGNQPLTISALSISGTSFAIDSANTCPAGTVLQPAAVCMVKVDFSPTTIQSFTGILTATATTLNSGTPVQFQFTIYGQGQEGNSTAPSTTTYVATPASVMVGQTINVVATVSDSMSITPTGTVQFLNGTAVVASATLTAGTTPGTATASATIPSMPAGTYSIAAAYGGSSTVSASTSATQSLTFTRATTTTIVTASALNLYVGQNETLTATISGFASPAMTGTVSFFDGTTPIGSGTVTGTSNGGVATLALGSTVPVGTHQFSATYNADANYTASTSQPITVTVAPQAATTINFFTSAGNPTAYERPFALVATVTTTAGGAPVTPGQVIFCDASLPRCNLLSNLGIAQTNSAGTATLHVNPGTVGTHTYVAVFVGTTSFQSVTSSTQQVTVFGSYPSLTSIASTGTTGNYTLTGTVAGLGSRTLSPTGTVSFMDNTDSQTLGAATLGAATLRFSEVQPTGSPLTVGRSPYGVAAGDLNGDGFVDIVTENYGSNTISVAFGNGDGTFLPPTTYAVGSLPERVLIADFNGDGYLDLVVANTGSNTVSVLLNNGNGTFAPQVTYPASSPVGLGVMDINHDGIADIVAAGYYSNTVSVLLGKGDGTFRAAVTYPTGNTPQTLAEGDFNGDGNVDLVVGNLNNNTVGVYLGNGDGTFATAVIYPVGSHPQGVQVGDFNGDGIADLAVSNSGDGTVSILIGNGNGTFQSQVTYAVGGSPVGLVIADFNGDGKQDISVGNTAQASLTQSILLGNGDGTFQPQLTFSTGNFPYGAAVGDFNGDGYPDLVVSNFSDGTATILLSQISQTATATIAGVALGSPPGTHQVAATYSGDTNFNGSASSSISLTAGGNPNETITGVTFTGSPANPTITIAGSGFNPQPAGDNQPTSIYNQTGQDFGVNGLYIMDNGIFGAGQDGDAIGLVNLSYTDTLISFQFGTDYPYEFANALAEGNSYTVSVNGLTFSGIVHYPALTQQTITFPPIPNQTFGNPPFTLNATASSGLPVSYAVISGPATVSGSTVTLTGAGAVVIQATQAGNSAYAAAPPVSQSFTVAQASQTITFPSIPNHTTTDQPFALAATASSGLPVSYAVTSGPAILSGSTVTLTGAGTVVIQATQPGNTNYAAATPISQSFIVSLATQTITFPAIPNQIYGNAPFTLSATASSGLPVSYAVTSGPATLSGNTVTITGAGAVTIQATQPGNTTYAAASPVSQSFTVATESQTITFPAIPNHVAGDPPFTLDATASSGLTVTYTVTSGPATVSGNTVTLTGPGTVVIQATQTGNTNFAAATPVSQSFLVASSSQTITFPPIPNHLVTDAPFTLAATASSGLPVTYAVTSGPATVSGSTVTLTGTGTVVIQATQPGNTTYAPALPVSQSFLVSLASQTITFPTIPNHTFGDAPFTLAATSSSNLAVTYSVTSGPATLSGNTVTLTGAGTVIIQATQAGNSTYAAATPVSQTFTVATEAQTITFPTIPNHTTTDQPFTLAATASSGLAVSYAVVSGPATISGSTVTLTGAGAVVIKASQPGNINFAAATPVSQTFTVSLATQTITFPTIPNQTYPAAPFTLSATASSGLAVTFAVTSGPATISGNTVTTTGAGTVILQATQAGNTIYAAATPVSQTFTVSAASQTITFPAIPNHTVTDAPFTISATASSSLPVTLAVMSGPATIAGNTVTLTGAGTVVILATQPGNTNYTAATPVTQSFIVSLATQTITFPAIPGHVFGDAPFTLAATASSGLPITYTVTSGPATISGNTVTLTGAGTVIIQAAQPGNTTYAAATSVNQSFIVLAPAPTLTSIAPASGVVNAPATTITLTGSNFVATDIVQLNGGALATTYVNPTTLTAVVPASFFLTAGTAQITVVDANNRTTAAQTFTVISSPAINFSGPATTTSAAQPTLTFQLVNPYPLTISGTLTLTFAASGTNGVDDPAVQFSAGGRTLAYSVPAFSTVTPTVQIQTGTVAGTATITLLVTSGGVNVTPSTVTPVQITIAPAPPTISTSALARSGNTLSVTIDGFSNTRELSTAIFHFNPAPGSTITTPDITAPVGTAFATYFSSAASTGFGSTFLYTQTFNLSTDATSIQSVTVTLVNTQGNSQVSTIQ